ncbi:MAG: hypothetical protein ACKV0T_06930 [Planctomycetales bacterium]
MDGNRTPAKNRRNLRTEDENDAQSDARGAHLDGDLEILVDAWPDLSEDARRLVMLAAGISTAVLNSQ